MAYLFLLVGLALALGSVEIIGTVIGLAFMGLAMITIDVKHI